MNNHNNKKQPKQSVVIKPKNAKQKYFMDLLDKDIEEAPVFFVLGSPGCGKTTCSINSAIKKLKNKEVNQIIITRPLVALEDIGYLPGRIEDKLEPYLLPIYDAIDTCAPGCLDSWLEDGTVSIEPIAFLQGRTLKDAVVVIDEFQNLTWQNFKMVATRIGENCRFIFDGDPDQIFLKNTKQSCVHFLSAFLEREEDGFYYVQFSEADSVRSGICKKIIKTIKEIDSDE